MPVARVPLEAVSNTPKTPLVITFIDKPLELQCTNVILDIVQLSRVLLI